MKATVITVECDDNNDDDGDHLSPWWHWWWQRLTVVVDCDDGGDDDQGEITINSILNNEAKGIARAFSYAPCFNVSAAH